MFPLFVVDPTVRAQCFDTAPKTLASVIGYEKKRPPYIHTRPKRGFKNPDRVVYALVNLSVLDKNFEAGEVVDLESLHAKKLLGKGETIVKVLANGEITKALTVKAKKFSAAAVAKIQAAGGTAEVI